MNFRITEIQAAIGIIQLTKLNEIVARKQRIYTWYQYEMANIAGIRILGAAPKSTLIPFRCVLIAPKAMQLMEHLERCGIQTRGFFPPMHGQLCFAKLYTGKSIAPSLHDEDYPNAMYGYVHGLCLPIFPTLTQDQVQYICRQISAFYA
jgi:perosamine synthetase